MLPEANDTPPSGFGARDLWKSLIDVSDIFGL